LAQAELSEDFVATAAYRRATAEAQRDNDAQALAALRRALEAGFDNWTAIDGESRFEQLRATAEFVALLEVFRR
jgi:hypothetical protein